MLLNNLTAISPVDGRYSSKTVELRPFFSEFALMKYRLRVEIEWFIFLSLEKNIKDLPPLSKNEIKKLRSIYENFSLKDSKKVKSIENKTNHDVKAIEYFFPQLPITIHSFYSASIFLGNISIWFSDKMS